MNAKNKTGLIILVIFMTGLILSQLPACSSVSQVASTPTTFWRKNAGTIETNDVARLQKELSFTIILPEYLPGGLQPYELIINYPYLDQIPDLTIIYYDLKNAREIQIFEGPPLDGYSRPLAPGLLAKMHPDYTPLELAGEEVLEYIGYGEIILSAKAIQVSSCQYIWEMNNLHFSSDIMGYDQNEARKIIESMIR
jgi:hypothetical protein